MCFVSQTCIIKLHSFTRFFFSLIFSEDFISWPTLFLEVLSVDQWERFRTEGYGTDYYCTRCLSSPNICYKFLTCLRELTKDFRHVLSKRNPRFNPYNVSNSLTESKTYACLTQAWPGRESDASVRHVLSKRNIRDIAKNDECNS